MKIVRSVLLGVLIVVALVFAIVEILVLDPTRRAFDNIDFYV